MSLITSYDTSQTEISYSSDPEYRAVFRKIFRMRMVSSDPNYVDPVTADELNFDVETASSMMDEIFDQTSLDGHFQALYDHAAAKMISLDRTSGMAVLFSYDYFVDFHRCLCAWLMDRPSWSTEHPAYVTMLAKIK